MVDKVNFAAERIDIFFLFIDGDGLNCQTICPRMVYYQVYENQVEQFLSQHKMFAIAKISSWCKTQM